MKSCVLFLLKVTIQNIAKIFASSEETIFLMLVRIKRKLSIKSLNVQYLLHRPQVHYNLIIFKSLKTLMVQKTGDANLPLHYGQVPSWLADRMTKLGTIMSQAIIHHY